MKLLVDNQLPEALAGSRPPTGSWHCFGMFWARMPDKQNSALARRQVVVGKLFDKLNFCSYDISRAD